MLFKLNRFSQGGENYLQEAAQSQPRNHHEGCVWSKRCGGLTTEWSERVSDWQRRCSGRCPSTSHAAVPLGYTCDVKPSFRSFSFFKLPPQADTGTCSADKPCFLSDHMMSPTNVPSKDIPGDAFGHWKRSWSDFGAIPRQTLTKASTVDF